MNPAADRRRTGFTLIEMTVVIALIVLVATIALPSIVRLFSAGSGAQAYNMLAAQLSSARALAIRDGTYTAVHIQPAHGERDPELEGVFFVGIFQRVMRDEDGELLSEPVFRLAAGYSPRRVPGRIGFGEVAEKWLDGGDRFTAMDEDDLKEFSSLNVIFAPDGRVVRRVEGGVPRFGADDTLFGGDGIWDDDGELTDKSGAVAIGMFDTTELTPLIADEDAVQEYLNVNVRFIPINQYTGELFPRE